MWLSVCNFILKTYYIEMFCWVRVAHLFSFLCCPIMCHYALSSVLWCPLRLPHKSDVRFVFTAIFLQEGSCLIYVICVCLRIVVFNTSCVVLCFCFVCLRLVYTRLPFFSGLSNFDCPFGILYRLFTTDITCLPITCCIFTYGLN